MTKQTHTPGPWTSGWQVGPVYRHPKTGCWHCSIMSNGITLIKVEGRTESECAEIAAKVSAAPETAAERDRLKAEKAELLEALKWALQGHDEIASHIQNGLGKELSLSIGHFGRLERVRAAIARAEGRA